MVDRLPHAFSIPRIGQTKNGRRVCRIIPAGQVPVRFELGFDPRAIQKGRTYALQARITAGSGCCFFTDTRHQVDPLAGKPPDSHADNGTN